MILSRLENALPWRSDSPQGPRRASTPHVEVLDLVRRLCETLNGRGVSYAHWKSNINVDRAQMGVDDLDLLVDRREASPFLEVLHQLGFRRVVDPPEKAVPGIQHYYAFGEASGSYVHVHAHFQLALGHDATKNFHLPMERALLDSALRDRLLPVAAPHFECLLYVIRMVLKFDLVRNPFAEMDRTGVHRELEYLENISDRSAVYRILDEHLPCVDREVFDACREAVRPGASNIARWNVRRRLHAALRPYARRSRFTDASLKVTRRFRSSLRSLLRLPKPGKRLADGGVVIAIVGGDGAGKSTSVEQLAGHFRGMVATRTAHLGKPKRSLLTRLVRNLHRAELAVQRRWPGKRLPSAGPSRLGLLLLKLKHCCTGRDRYRAFGRVRRWATQGHLVICDRWPLPDLKLMDSPKPLESTSSRTMNRILAGLREKEQHYHRKIQSPDLLIVLRVHPDIAVARRSDEREEFVRPRSQEVWDFDWQRVRAHVADGSKPVSDVVSELIAASWKAI